MVSWMVVRTAQSTLHSAKTVSRLPPWIMGCVDGAGETKDMPLGGRNPVDMKGVELERVHQ